jgi:hypothetical protein
MSKSRRSDDPLLVVLLTGVPWWSAPTAAAVTAGKVMDVTVTAITKQGLKLLEE